MNNNVSERDKAVKLLNIENDFCGVPCDFMDGIIKEKQTEIDRLKNKVEELSEVLSDTIRIRYAEIKAEGAKECIEKIKSRARKIVATDHGIVIAGSSSYTISENGLYNIEKEMLGDE